MSGLRTHSDWFEIEHGDDHAEVFVTFSVTPFIAPTYWQPAEGGEIEIESVDGSGFTMLADLSDANVTQITNHIANNLDRYVEDDGPDPDDERDRRIDARLTGAGH